MTSLISAASGGSETIDSGIARVLLSWGHGQAQCAPRDISRIVLPRAASVLMRSLTVCDRANQRTEIEDFRLHDPGNPDRYIERA